MLFPSCADQSRRQEVHLIGTAPPTECFVMIECPPPWGHSIQQAKGLPTALREMLDKPDDKKRGIRFFLIHGSCDVDPKTHSQNFFGRRVLIFQRPHGFASEYQTTEIQVSNLDEAAIAIQQYFAGDNLSCWTQSTLMRDIFICTHGQHDRCCGRYGYPFYRSAQQLKSEWNIPNLRFWQISHIGGHRFAPTLIDLPQGRYYGRMDLDSLKQLILYRGNWQLLIERYRGWSLLPSPLQTLECLFWQNQGWQWLIHDIRHEVLDISDNRQRWQAEFAHRDTDGLVHQWWAEIVEDVSQRVSIMGSCGDTKELLSKRYQISALRAMSNVEQTVA
ncbi:MAG: sucrase ferredoxin [Cyanobacteria bacterium P01_A01_bin.37]